MAYHDKFCIGTIEVHVIKLCNYSNIFKWHMSHFRPPLHEIVLQVEI